MEGVIGVVTMVAYDFAPKNWAYCNGQLLAIQQNQALFSILGTTYGGNGVTTFALPDLRGRRPVSQGQSSTGTYYQLGQVGGTETATVGISTMPPHVHNGTINLALGASTDAGTDTVAENNYIGSGTANSFSTNANASFGAPTVAANILPAGGSQPFNTMMPYLVVNYVICLYGLFPSRN
jgi:microcystin-dependent protein